MNNNLLHVALLASAFLLLFATAELLYRVFKVKAEVTRKMVHIVTGLLTLLFPPFIDGHWWVMALCGSFFLILAVSMRTGWLPSINAVDRVTRGSLLYPVVVYGCYLAYAHHRDMTLYYIPILTLAIADPMAAFVGKTFPRGRYVLLGHAKTLSGSSGFLVAAVLVAVVSFRITTELTVSAMIIPACVIAVVSTLAEAVSHKGYDNLSIPGVSLAALWLIRYFFHMV
ncbi:MAG: phosphatidate cytidylyltransferase [Flavobacteriales bacterium]|nr:hypothetical protein [Flavobacteriales bacterium]MCB9449004.1 phosphatidate cytidylyltransferase [Flavobacteriales bacterium]